MKTLLKITILVSFLYLTSFISQSILGLIKTTESYKYIESRVENIALKVTGKQDLLFAETQGTGSLVLFDKKMRYHYELETFKETQTSSINLANSFDLFNFGLEEEKYANNIVMFDDIRRDDYSRRRNIYSFTKNEASKVVKTIKQNKNKFRALKRRALSRAN